MLRRIFDSYKTILLISVLIVFNSYASTKKSNNIIYDLKVLQEKTFQISPGKELYLETSTGDVVVNSWDKPQVYVKILGNSKAEDKMHFSFDNDENSVKIVGKKEGSLFSWFSSGINLRYEITVPSKFNTKIETSGGDIKLSDITGDNFIKTSGGDIWVNSTTGQLNVKTSGGDINFGDTNGNIDLKTSGGEISGMDFNGNVDVSTSGGDIKLIGKDSKIKAATSGGDIMLDYSGLNKGIELYTSGGDIDVKLPADFNASAKLTTSGGEISSSFKSSNVQKMSSSKLIADFNNGGESLIVKTSGGDITLRQK